MTSKTQSTKLSESLAEAAKLRARQLGYPSWNAYLKGLIRYDLMVQGKHDLTLPLSARPLLEQDKADDRLLEITKKGEGKRGQLLAHIMQRIQKGETLEAALDGKS